jgi:peptide/nickel transport system permease protein
VLVYVGKRLAMTVLVMALIMVFLALIVHLVPGDPARKILGQNATPELIEAVNAQMGLDRPVAEQVWDFVSNAVQGDLGRDFYSQIPVTTLVGQSLIDTILLALASLLVSVVVGVPLGVLAARYPNTLLDRALGGLSILFLCGISYVVGLILLLVFSVQLGWLPALGTGELSDPVDYIRHLILPAVALSVIWWGYIARLVRASMLEVLGSSYIRTARAFGFKKRLVFYKYALKNALVPVVGLLGLMIGYTLAGTVFVELIFSRPGLGSLALEAIEVRNWPIIRATVLLYAVFFTFGNLVADLAYRLLDPRIRLERGVDVAV